MSNFSVRGAGAALMVLGGLLLLSFLGSLLGLAGPMLYFFWFPGEILFKGLHLAGLYVIAYLFSVGGLVLLDRLKARIFALLSLGMIPAFLAGISLRLMIQGDARGALLPSWLVEKLGLEGTVIVSAALALVSFIAIIQVPFTQSGKNQTVRSGNGNSGLQRQAAAGSSVYGNANQGFVQTGNHPGNAQSGYPADNHEDPAGENAEPGGNDEDEESGPLVSLDAEAVRAREFKQAMAGRLEVPAPVVRPDLDNPEPVDPRLPLAGDESGDPVSMNSGTRPAQGAAASYRVPLASTALMDRQSGAGARGASVIADDSIPLPKRPMFFDPEMDEEDEDLEVYFSKDGSISDYPPKGRHTWVTSLEGDEDPSAGDDEDEADEIPAWSRGQAHQAHQAHQGSQGLQASALQESSVAPAREADTQAWAEARGQAMEYVNNRDFYHDEGDQSLGEPEAPRTGESRNQAATGLDYPEIQDEAPSGPWADDELAPYDDNDHLDGQEYADPAGESASLSPGMEEVKSLEERSAHVHGAHEPVDQAAPVQAAVHEGINTALLPPMSSATTVFRSRDYSVPIHGILEEPKNHQYWVIDEATQRAASILKQTLEEFGVAADVTGIRKGPVITMFEILPAPGVKLARITSLADNIALRLAAQTVRIVAPIPGKHAVGIEIPNRDRAVVSFAELLMAEGFQSPKMEIPVALGKDITGEAQIVDLTRTPHLLIAGSTGSGKSVCVNALICSILYRKSPAEVNLILIDPKIVELKFYNDIPHLLTPVITDPKKAFQAIQWCLYEMERRYSLLDAMQVRDIKSYNKKIKTRNIATPHMPYLVVVIDEFADLMATSGKELEGTLARLAAMSRAVGIHLVLATQRPSTDVITGLIKANIPSRIAFMVASKIDSRIILDSMGAEKLLGKGDMLFTSAWDPFPFRMQGAFLSEDEVERVVSHVKTLGKPDYIDDEIFFEDEEEDDPDGEAYVDGDDPLMKEAIDIVVSAKKASASYLQRRLKIGYNRAARLVEQMEEMGIVGPAQGSKAREILRMFQ